VCDHCCLSSKILLRESRLDCCQSLRCDLVSVLKVDVGLRSPHKSHNELKDCCASRRWSSKVNTYTSTKLQRKANFSGRCTILASGDSLLRRPHDNYSLVGIIFPPDPTAAPHLGPVQTAAFLPCTGPNEPKPLPLATACRLHLFPPSPRRHHASQPS